MMTPRSSCPGEESIPLQGPNLRLIYEINNVTDTALGNLAGAALIPARASPIDRLGHSWKAEAGQFWRAPKSEDAIIGPEAPPKVQVLQAPGRLLIGAAEDLPRCASGGRPSLTWRI